MSRSIHMPLRFKRNCIAISMQKMTVCLYFTAGEDYTTTVADVILNDDGEAMIYIPIINDEVLEDMLERFEVRVTATANVTGVPADIPQESVSVFIVDADDGKCSNTGMSTF